jgi:hypothetical protein
MSEWHEILERVNRMGVQIEGVRQTILRHNRNLRRYIAQMRWFLVSVGRIAHPHLFEGGISQAYFEASVSRAIVTDWRRLKP